jgi:nitrogen fixation NifU-like protein
MTDLRDLYQEVILDHSKHPRNRRKPEAFTASADGHNPLCGDHLTVYLSVDGDTVTDVAFDGGGCAVSTASASMMTDALRGKSREEATRIFHAFHDVLTGKVAVDDVRETLGKLAVFAGVAEFPVRVKCATLAWHTVKTAMDRPGETVSTE